ncbi:MAG: glycosyltransferase family 1 protein [Candidatus Omnitrophota bacterium]
MKILFNISPAERCATGAGTYARELLTHLLQVDTRNSYTIFSVKNPFGRTRGFPVQGENKNISHVSIFFPYRYMNMLWNNFGSFPIERMAGVNDVAHSLDKIAPFTKTMKTVLTVHDMLWHVSETGKYRRKGLVYQQIMESIKRAGAIITNSEFSRDEISKYLPFAREKVHIIPLGVSERLFPVDKSAIPGAVHERYPWDDYILYLGTLSDPRKNVELIVDAYADLKKRKRVREKLLLCGAVSRRYNAGLLHSIKRAGLPDDIIVCSGWIPDSYISYIYNKARIVLFPSLYEGFGLPVLEAMACGKPVITSDIPPMNEVASDAAILIDPRDGKAMADSMEMLLSDTVLYRKMADKGLRRAKDFPWTRTARETLSVYEKVCA